jgi:hypothetical protein
MNNLLIPLYEKHKFFSRCAKYFVSRGKHKFFATKARCEDVKSFFKNRTSLMTSLIKSAMQRTSIKRLPKLANKVKSFCNGSRQKLLKSHQKIEL